METFTFDKNMDTTDKQDGTRKLYRRMAFIVEYLKTHSAVTLEKLLVGIVKAGLGAGSQGKCSRQSVYRAINTLSDKYKCPVRYDVPTHTYVLDNPEWEFVAPTILSDSELLALTLGAKFAHDFLPNTVAGRIEDAVDKTLEGSGARRFTNELTDAFKFLSGRRPDDNGDIFRAVFEAWSSRRLLYITYKDENGMETKRIIEPQALAFFDMEWTIRAYCHKRDAPRTFLLSRISSAAIQDETFEPRRELIDSLTFDTFYNYTDKISNARFRLSERGAQYAKKHILHTCQIIEPANKLGWYILTVPEASPERIFPWVFAKKGEADPLSPNVLVEEVRKQERQLAKAIGAV
ncbi:MAG: WYL domain-containing protein [Victivallales bacterium]|nr:WYL domain-containing protein [Victivallales bacterium]